MQKLELNKPHPTLRPPVPEGGFFNWTNAAAELLLSFRGPSAREVEAVRTGECEFALVDLPPAVWLLYKFDPALPWSDAPYTIHVLPDADQPDPVLFTNRDQKLLLQILLVDAADATIRAIRAVTLSPEFSNKLLDLVSAQRLAAWTGRADYDREIQKVYGQYPSTDAMLKKAIVRTKGGA